MILGFKVPSEFLSFLKQSRNSVSFKFCFHWKIKENTMVLRCTFICIEICVYNSIHLLNEVRYRKNDGLLGLYEELSVGLAKSTRGCSSIYLFSRRFFFSCDLMILRFPGGLDSLELDCLMSLFVLSCADFEHVKFLKAAVKSLTYSHLVGTGPAVGALKLSCLLAEQALVPQLLIVLQLSAILAALHWLAFWYLSWVGGTRGGLRLGAE